MQSLNSTLLRIFLTALLLGIPFASHSAATENSRPPTSPSPASPAPGVLVKELAQRPAPNLMVTGDLAQKNALAFITWASASSKDQDDLVRRLLARASGNRAIAEAFCREAFDKQLTDYDRALVTLALLGEMRSPYSLDCFVKFINQPLPEKGTVVEGEVLEKTALASLQAKAIDGLAYLRDKLADQRVLEAIARHPSRIVRAEGMTAYLWNHAQDPTAKEQLKNYVRPDEVIFIDRLVKAQGETGETFNRKLAAYLKEHPEVIPPEPTVAKPSTDPNAEKPTQY